MQRNRYATRWLDLSILAVMAGWALFLLIGLLTAPGCSDSTNEPGVTISTAGAAGSSEPRILALLPFAADQLIAMGVQPIAVPKLSGTVPHAWAGLPTVVMDHSAGPNAEQLIAHSPDIIITSSIYSQFVDGIKAATGAEVVIMDINSVEDVAKNIRTLGVLSNATEQSESLARSVETELSDPFEPDSAPVDVLAIFGTPHAFYAFLPESYLGDLVEHSGGRFITDGMSEHRVFRGLAPLSMEVVIDRDPDQLLVLFHGPQESAQAMLDRDPLWSELTAVKDGAVTFLQDDLYAMRPGSELGRAMAGIRAIMDEARARRP